MKDDRFCELQTMFSGEKIDKVGQLTYAKFTGEELKEYIEFFIDQESHEAVLVKTLEEVNYLLGDNSPGKIENKIQLAHIKILQALT